MSARTVDWSTPQAAGSAPEGLRERKKRLLRQQLSDTATQMFMERGFDAVRVTEVAEACGVSEKTVYNYFPTKESLLLDRGDATMTSLRAGLAEPGRAPVEVAQEVLDGEMGAMMSWLATQHDRATASATLLRFGELIRATPALRAHERDLADRLIAMGTEVLADRAGVSADAPEPRIVATALLGLWDVQHRSLAKHLDGVRAPEEVRNEVAEDVRRAARLLDAGLRSFGSD